MSRCRREDCFIRQEQRPLTNLYDDFPEKQVSNLREYISSSMPNFRSNQFLREYRETASSRDRRHG